MGSSKPMDQHKSKYRLRFYQNRAENSHGLRPGIKVLSTITNYFNDSGGGKSPGISRSFFADSVTNINTPESIQKEQDSATNPDISILNELPFTGEIKETEMTATSSRTVIKKGDPLPRLINVNVQVLREEMDYSESDIPLNLVIEKGTGTKNLRSERNTSRDRIYSSDNSVVQALFPSPASLSSPQKRLRFSDASKDDEGFESVFASRSKKDPADDVQPKRMCKSVRFSGNKTDARSRATAAPCVSNEENEDFIIEGEESTNMSFFVVNERSSVGSSKETRSAASSTACGNPQSPVKSKAVSAQAPGYSQIQQTSQLIGELEKVKEGNFYQIWGADRERIKSARNSKSKAEGIKSGSVLHEMLEIEPAETVAEQSTVQSQTVRNTLKDDKTNKTKDKLCKEKNSFKFHLVNIPNSEPPIKRMDITDFDLPVVPEEEEFVIHEISGSDLESWDKKPRKIPNDRKKNKKSEKNVPSEVSNVPFTSSMDREKNVTDSKKNQNNAKGSFSPSKEKKRKRRTEVEKLALLEGLQKEIEKISNCPRRVRLTQEAAAWQAVKFSTFESEDAFLQHSLESNNASDESADEIFKLKERGSQDQDEEGYLTQKDEKNSSKKTLNTRKRTKKLKHVQSQEKAGPSEVKRPKIKKKPQTSSKKSLQSTNLCRQLEHETLENNPTDSPKHDLNVHDLPNEVLHLSKSAIPASPPISEPQSPSPKSPTFACSSNFKSDIQLEYLENRNTEEREMQSHHRLPRQSHTSSACDSAKLSFQSGPVLKTRAVRHDNQVDTVVRNLTSPGSFSIANLSPMAVVLDPDTNRDALAECIHHADNNKESSSLMSICFNNHIFSAGKLLLKPMEKEVRNTPQSDILVFYIVKGKAILKLHKSYHNLKSGDFFFVPPSNTYNIHNSEKEDVELIFTQLKCRAD